jgi:hypothetical protein
MSSGTKKFQFLLLDAGPIIKLFELGMWDTFIQRCDVTVSKIVANEAKYASQELQDIRIDLEPYQDKDSIQILDTESSLAKSLLDKLPESYKDIVHDGEKQTLAILVSSPEVWKVCAADTAVFWVLGYLGKAEQGISLEEVFSEIGLTRALEWQFSKRFREKYTKLGQIDSIQR